MTQLLTWAWLRLTLSIYGRFALVAHAQTQRHIRKGYLDYVH
jgi:hypothetical protein